MDIINKLISGYPTGDVSPQDFIDRLSVGADGWQMAWVSIALAVVSFNPWCNMWLAIAPDFFSIGENPWYYIMGAICLFLSIRGLVIYKKLPQE